MLTHSHHVSILNKIYTKCDKDTFYVDVDAALVNFRIFSKYVNWIRLSPKDKEEMVF